MLAWHHLPKTAGTSTDRLFELSGLPLLWRDAQTSPLKHLPLSEHPENLSVGDRQKLLNVRRLPYWLLSNFHHKKLFMGLEIDEKHMQKGFFYRVNEKRWLPADWWLSRMGVDDSWLGLRVEHLKSDLLKIFAKYEPINFSSRCSIVLSRERNKNRYMRNLNKWFSANQIHELYSNNPRWTALERRVYGDILNL